MDKKHTRHIIKLIEKLQNRNATIEIYENNELALKDSRSGANFAKTTQAELSLMASRGLIKYSGHKITLTTEAHSFLQRHKNADSSFNDQHYAVEHVQVGEGNSATRLSRNVEESPLSTLNRRKTKSGVPFLSDEEFKAGERLRRDFTFGALMPSVTMRWEEKSSGHQAGPPTDLSDETLSARQRVNKALQALGPDLGSVLIDVCCFLKGMETLEKERQWPVRSAKVVLKTALAALDRHYNPQQRPMPSQYGVIHSMEMSAF